MCLKEISLEFNLMPKKEEEETTVEYHEKNI